jgi:drug/metabolite transporter (DMT)-like permease
LPPRLQALLAVIFWGISFVATKAALREVSPPTLITVRFALGVALLLALLARRDGRLLPPRDAWGGLALMGFVGVLVHQALQAVGLTLTTAAKTGWLIGLTPVWSAVLAAVVLRERFGAAKLGGLALGFAGATLVVTGGRPLGEVLAVPSTRGDLLILASTLNWAIYSVLGHGLLKRLGALRATAGALTLGWLMVLPWFAATQGWRELPGLSLSAWGAITFLGIACSGLGYLFWYGALERVEASQVAALLYLEPLVTMAAAVALLGEPVRITTVAGGLLVLAGVILVQRPARRKG